MLTEEDEFDEETFEGSDFRGATLRSKSFSDCEFRECSFQKADFRYSVFENCRLSGCDLTMALVADARFLDVEFKDCKLMGIDWSQVSGLVFSVGFTRCVLSHGSFIDLAMKNVRVIDCRADETNFSGSNLQGADFSRTNLEAAKFAGADLTRADLSQATNYAINPNDSILRDTRFSIGAALAVAKRMGIVVPGE